MTKRCVLLALLAIGCGVPPAPPDEDALGALPAWLEARAEDIRVNPWDPRFVAVGYPPIVIDVEAMGVVQRAGDWAEGWGELYDQDGRAILWRPENDLVDGVDVGPSLDARQNEAYAAVFDDVGGVVVDKSTGDELFRLNDASVAIFEAGAVALLVVPDGQDQISRVWTGREILDGDRFSANDAFVRVSGDAVMVRSTGEVLPTGPACLARTEPFFLESDDDGMSAHGLDGPPVRLCRPAINSPNLCMGDYARCDIVEVRRLDGQLALGASDGHLFSAFETSPGGSGFFASQRNNAAREVEDDTWSFVFANGTAVDSPIGYSGSRSGVGGIWNDDETAVAAWSPFTNQWMVHVDTGSVRGIPARDHTQITHDAFVSWNENGGAVLDFVTKLDRAIEPPLTAVAFSGRQVAVLDGDRRLRVEAMVVPRQQLVAEGPFDAILLSLPTIALLAQTIDDRPGIALVPVPEL
jgi:hypothetical protein